MYSVRQFTQLFSLLTVNVSPKKKKKRKKPRFIGNFLRIFSTLNRDYYSLDFNLEPLLVEIKASMPRPIRNCSQRRILF